MPGGIRQKWRPSLALVLGGVLGTVFSLPFAGIFVLRRLSPIIGYNEAYWSVGLSIILMTAVLGFLLWRLLYGPMKALAQRAERIKSGDPDVVQPLRRYGTRELQDLGRSMMDMAGTLNNREATIRTYTDHVTHELKSPLTSIRGAAEMLSDGQVSQSDAATLAETVSTASARMEHLLHSMRGLAAVRHPGHGGRCTLADVLAQLRSHFAELNLIADGEKTQLPLNDGALTIILEHLLSNAGNHEATEVRMSVSRDAQFSTLRVVDNGRGVSPGNRDKIFAPFFTTRRDSGGTGMGLAILRALLDTLGATIELDDSGGGAAFVIQFKRS